MLIWWRCTSLHFLIDFINSNFSPTLTYSNLFLFTNAFICFPNKIFNVTFYTTLRSFNLFLINTFSILFFVCMLKITFSPTFTHSDIFLFNAACFTSCTFYCIWIWFVGVTICLTGFVCLIRKTTFLWRRLWCILLSNLFPWLIF